MITDEQFHEAMAQEEAAKKVIQAYGKQSLENFDARWKKFLGGEFFTYADLRFAAGARCQCGAGLAHPKGCGPWHHWKCSAVLTGRVPDEKGERGIPVHGEFSFQFYEIKSEDQPSANGTTTRPK